MKNTTLSIVICGRNDNHNGDFNLRAEYAIKHNTALLKKHGIAFEFIWIEWNPLPDQPLLADSIRKWTGPIFHGFVVPKEIHNHLCDNPSISVMQFHAKNVGIRRARGKWILSMNADTYLTNEVLEQARINLDNPNVFHIATRIDFASEHLRIPPESYPIQDLATRTVTKVSEVSIPISYGSVGDFTLIERNAFHAIGGHYEGIRFSNLHLDTILCRQWEHSGGTFDQLGSIYHADHADSWNNFAFGDDRIHHNGCNYDQGRINIPYTNSPNWGLGNFHEKSLSTGTVELCPPNGMILRKKRPAQAIVPDEFSGLVKFTDTFHQAVKELRNRSARIVIYGLGDQVVQALRRDILKGLNIIGFIDDRPKPDTGTPYEQISWEEAKQRRFDAVLLGSMYWAQQLRKRAEQHVDPLIIFPPA